ncbi:MAG: hypothetical protein AB7O45_00515 [Alphaproteobacteria bacterium]
MSFAADRFADEMEAYGEACTLRRPTSTPVDVAVKAKFYGVESSGIADQLVGVRGQTTMRVKISNREIAAASWPGPPVKGDFLIRGVNGREYILLGDADTRWHDDAVAAHFLVVEG